MTTRWHMDDRAAPDRAAPDDGREPARGGDEGPEGRGFAEDVFARLRDQRVLWVRGELDEAQASEVAATLMSLDALGDDPVEVRISARSGSVDAALLLVDVIDVLGVPVHTVALGVVGGGAVAVLAAGAHRAVSGHARLHLREDDGAVGGRALEIERVVAHQQARREAFFRHISARTGRPVSDIEAEWAAGAFLDAQDAVSLGYADGIVS